MGKRKRESEREGGEEEAREGGRGRGRKREREREGGEEEEWEGRRGRGKVRCFNSVHVFMWGRDRCACTCDYNVV